MRTQRNSIARLSAALAVGLLAGEASAGFSIPLIQSASADNILIGGGATLPITVTYDSNNGASFPLAASSIDPGDIAVTGPGGALSVLGVVLDPMVDAEFIAATYTVAAPSGSWDAGDNGVYTVDMNSAEVWITIAPSNSVPAQAGIASFVVNIPEPTSLALLACGAVLAAGRVR